MSKFGNKQREFISKKERAPQADGFWEAALNLAKLIQLDGDNIKEDSVSGFAASQYHPNRGMHERVIDGIDHANSTHGRLHKGLQILVNQFAQAEAAKEYGLGSQVFKIEAERQQEKLWKEIQTRYGVEKPQTPTQQK